MEWASETFDLQYATRYERDGIFSFSFQKAGSGTEESRNVRIVNFSKQDILALRIVCDQKEGKGDQLIHKVLPLETKNLSFPLVRMLTIHYRYI